MSGVANVPGIPVFLVGGTYVSSRFVVPVMGSTLTVPDNCAEAIITANSMITIIQTTAMQQSPGLPIPTGRLLKIVFLSGGTISGSQFAGSVTIPTAIGTRIVSLEEVNGQWVIGGSAGTTGGVAPPTITPTAGVLVVPDGIPRVIVPTYQDITKVQFQSMVAGNTPVPSPSSLGIMFAAGGSLFNSTGTGTIYPNGPAFAALYDYNGNWVVA